MEQFAQATIFGLALGGVIAVSAVGLTLSYGVTGFINFSYGELLTIGAYATFALAALGLPLLPAALAAVALAGLTSVLVARLFFEPLRDKGVLPLLITSVGVAFILQNLVQIGFGADPQAFPAPLLRPWRLGPVFVPKAQAAIFAVALVTMLALYAMLALTLLGRKMRATAVNDALARISGVNTVATVRITWLVSGLVAGLGGALLGAAQGSLSPTMGFRFLLVVFAATLVGGIGNPYGAMVGAIVVGLGIEYGTTYVSADYGVAVAFVLLVTALLVRPSGILGRSRVAAEVT
ncbi:MAG: branched-chain amino acid ABC transporter permease [Actinomycetota bacterium]|nr:branched-chain amino acid ABC transporter permease [Actinomycetota bacterium]